MGLRKVFGESSDLPFGDTENLGDIGDGGAFAVGIEPADDGGVIGAIEIEDENDHLIFTVVGEVEIDIGEFVEGHAFAIEEALKVEFKADWADSGNFEAIADERISGASSGDPIDLALAAFLKDLPSGEEIRFISDFRYYLKFFLQLDFVLI